VRGATVTLLADRRTDGALEVARALSARLRAAVPDHPVVLIADPAFRTRAGKKAGVRDPGEVVGPASVPALLGRLPARGYALVAFLGPVRQQVVAALDRSALVVLLTDVAVASLRAAQRTLRLLTEVGYPVDKVAVVVVTARSQATIDHNALRTALRRDVVQVLPRVITSAADEAAYDALVDRIRSA
jgi:hypothetical protein